VFSAKGGRLRRGGSLTLAVVAGVLAVFVWAGLAGGTQPYETYLSAVSTDSPVAQFRFSDAVGSGTVADSVGTFSATNTGITLGGEGPFGGSKSGLFAAVKSTVERD
jgi:hypothetical protein